MDALLFSGGKDSMACLYLNRHRLDDLYVIFANTGKFYPEHLETVDHAKAMCKHWIEIRTDRDGQWEANGLPADVVPIDWTVYGQITSSRKPVTVQSYLQCCNENISIPLWNAIKKLGCKTVIRGQRSAELHRSSAKDGDTYDGVMFSHPIEQWTVDQVLSYLREQMGDLPEHFQLEHSSMDCYDCTAYRKHSKDRVHWTRERHPALYAEYSAKTALLDSAMKEAMSG